MFKNFDKVKSQFAQLAKILNSFQSEAVQLRLLEILLDDEATETSTTKPDPKKTVKRKKKIVSSSRNAGKPIGGSVSRSKRNQKRRVGGFAMIDMLIKEGFFTDRRSATNIIEHCKANKATVYKAGDFSTKLSKLTRDGKLKREKNSDKQYEYWQE